MTQTMTPEHAVAAITAEEYRDLLATQVGATASSRVRALQLEQQLKDAEAERDALSERCDDLEAERAALLAATTEAEPAAEVEPDKAHEIEAMLEIHEGFAHEG